MEKLNEYSREAYDAAEGEVTEAKSKILPEVPVAELKSAVDAITQAEEKRTGFKEPEEEAKERTRETEIQRNVEAWKVRARILELDIDDEAIKVEVRAAIEAVSEEKAKELGEEVAYEVMLKGVTPSQMLKLAKEYSRYYEQEGIDEYFDTQKLPRSNKDQSYAIAYAFQQEPDQDSLGKKARSAKDWEKTDEEFMSLPERVLAGASWKQEKDSELDEKNWTLCAGSRLEHDDVPYLYFHPDRRKIDFHNVSPGHCSPYLGVRRVVSSRKS